MKPARLLVSLLSVVTALSVAPPVRGDALLLRKPSVSKTQIVFGYGGDLWIVARSGGDARRLTSDIGIESSPTFSPDGTWVAFTGEYDGNEDIYIVPAAGGQPKRLTSFPGADQVVGWTRDGKRVLFSLAAPELLPLQSPVHRQRRRRLAQVLPLPMAEEGVCSPDGTQLAYVPFTNFKESWDFFRGLKHYRGGTASPIWIARLSDSSIEKLPRKDSNDSTPMWLGNHIYFLSDRSGPVSLFSYDPSNKTINEVVASNGLDI